MEIETRFCPAKQHTFVSQGHNSREASIILFRKNPNDPNSPLLKNCLDCRKYSREVSARFTNKHLELHEESKKKGDGYLYCPHKSHETLSKIKRDQVPEEMFLKDVNNPNSQMVQQCSDCRKIRSEQVKIFRQVKKSEAKELGRFYCTNCHHSYDLNRVALNLDGSYSTLCVNCKIGEKQRSVSIRDYYRLVKMEQLVALNASCNKCKSLYIRDPTDQSLVELKSFETDEGRMVVFDGETFLAKDIIASGSDMLELDTLELDHLPEDEMRAKGLLQPDETYIPKIRNVSKMSSEYAIKSEASKCQLICMRCHVEETVRREGVGKDITDRSYLEREKMTYVNSLKSEGCQICSYVNVDLLRFFHLDHLNPLEKIECIARMVKDKTYSLDDVKAEIAKCRVLCGNCHKLHTKDQRLKGEIPLGRGTKH